MERPTIVYFKCIRVPRKKGDQVIRPRKRNYEMYLRFLRLLVQIILPSYFTQLSSPYSHSPTTHPHVFVYAHFHFTILFQQFLFFHLGRELMQESVPLELEQFTLIDPSVTVQNQEERKRRAHISSTLEDLDRGAQLHVF